MTGDHRQVQQSTSAALVAAVNSAGYAPSIHNTQPWRWRVRHDNVELYGERSRQLAVTDPSGRLLTVSCGVALQHVRVALAAEGWQATVDRLPDEDQPDLLARVTVTGRVPVTVPAMRLLQTVRMRHTDRRPVTGSPVTAEALAAIRQSVADEGARLHLLSREDVLELASTADRAQAAESLDPQWREEMAYWAGGDRANGLGIPDSVIPDEAPHTTVPGRDFGHSGALPVSAGHDGAASFAILYGDEDTPVGWLRGGEALSAGWLTATELGVSVLPLSATIEVTSTRQALRRLLSYLGEPYLVLRLGIADPDHAGPPPTPRLRTTQVIDTIEP